jgi:hypothetical protein
MSGSRGLGIVWGICRGDREVSDGLLVLETRRLDRYLCLHLRLMLSVSGNRLTGVEVMGGQGVHIHEEMKHEGRDEFARTKSAKWSDGLRLVFRKNGFESFSLLDSTIEIDWTRISESPYPHHHL